MFGQSVFVWAGALFAELHREGPQDTAWRPRRPWRPWRPASGVPGVPGPLRCNPPKLHRGPLSLKGVWVFKAWSATLYYSLTHAQGSLEVAWHEIDTAGAGSVAALGPWSVHMLASAGGIHQALSVTQVLHALSFVFRLLYLQKRVPFNC